jgi:hypothetical protein
MIVRFFRSTGIVVIGAIFTICVLSWLHVFSGAEITTFGETDLFFFSPLNDFLANVPVALLGFAILLLIAGILVFVNTRVRLIEKFSYLPALCYVLLIGGAPEIHMFSRFGISAIFLVIAYSILVGSFESERLSYKYFTAPIYIAIATFFYPYMYMYMAVVWISLAIGANGFFPYWGLLSRYFSHLVGFSLLKMILAGWALFLKKY